MKAPPITVSTSTSRNRPRAAARRRADQAEAAEHHRPGCRLGNGSADGHRVDIGRVVAGAEAGEGQGVALTGLEREGARAGARRERLAAGGAERAQVEGAERDGVGLIAGGGAILRTTGVQPVQSEGARLVRGEGLAQRAQALNEALFGAIRRRQARPCAIAFVLQAGRAGPCASRASGTAGGRLAEIAIVADRRALGLETAIRELRVRSGSAKCGDRCRAKNPKLHDTHPFINSATILRWSQIAGPSRLLPAGPALGLSGNAQPAGGTIPLC